MSPPARPATARRFGADPTRRPQDRPRPEAAGRSARRGRYARPPRAERGRRAVAMDPRIEERRAGVQRQQARRRFRRLLAVLAVAAVVAAGWAVAHSRLFGARVVTVVGVPSSQRTAIVQAAGLTAAPPLLDVGAGTATAVERLPWVATATVTRQWPDGVRVAVTVRRPVAVLPDGTGFAEVDKGGRVLATVASAPAGMVQLAGTTSPGSPGTTLAGARAALAVASTLPKAFRSQVTQVQEGPGGDITLHLTSPVTVYLGSTSNLSAKYEDAAALLAAASLVQGEVIDVSAPSTPVVRP